MIGILRGIQLPMMFTIVTLRHRSPRTKVGGYGNRGFWAALDEHPTLLRARIFRILPIVCVSHLRNRVLCIKGPFSSRARKGSVIATRATPRAGIDEIVSHCSLLGTQAMRDNTMPAGGAEVVALTHVLERPVHVYELASTGRRYGSSRHALIVCLAFGIGLTISKHRYAPHEVGIFVGEARSPPLDRRVCDTSIQYKLV